VTGFLRIVGVANAAVWFGASIFFTFAVGPALFSSDMIEMIRRLGGIDAEAAKAYAGFVAEVVIKRYFSVHLICAIIALVHLIAEWLYMGKPLQRWTLWLLLAVFGLSLAGGLGFQPKMRALHRDMYAQDAAPEQRAQARKSFNRWHGASQVLNLMVLAGVAAYLWRVTTPGSGYRYRV
jgi:Domain of unknown function (DUF4149)